LQVRLIIFDLEILEESTKLERVYPSLKIGYG